MRKSQSLIQITVLIIFAIVIGFLIYKAYFISPTHLNRDNIKNIKAIVPTASGDTGIDITGSDFDNVVSSFNKSRITSNNGGYDGLIIKIEIWLKDGSRILLIEDGPKTVRVQGLTGEVEKKIVSPWIAQFIHNLRVTYKAAW